MKKTTFIMTILFNMACVNTYADWVDNAKTKTEDSLKPLVRDIGRLINGGNYKYACSLDFPGAMINLGNSIISISNNNKIIDSGAVFTPYASAMLALPNNMSLALRGMSLPVSGSDMSLLFLGGSVSYALAEDKTMPFSPAITVFSAFNTMKTEDVMFNGFVMGMVISKKLPLISPYIGVSYDMSVCRIETPFGGLKPSENELRFGGGLNVRVFSMLHINAEATNLGYDAGLGLKIGIPG